MLVARQPYSVVSTPLLDQDDPVGAATGLIDAARAAAALPLMIPDLPLDGPAADALNEAHGAPRLRPAIDNVRQRARARRHGRRRGLSPRRPGGKKAQGTAPPEPPACREGASAFVPRSAPAEIGAGRSTVFWCSKPRAGRVAAAPDSRQDAADAAVHPHRRHRPGGPRPLFAAGIAGRCKTIAAGHRAAARATMRCSSRSPSTNAIARFSPGVQLTVELTRRLCADPTIRFVDSGADAGPPDDRPRLARTAWRVGDLFIPTGRAAAAKPRSALRRPPPPPASGQIHLTTCFRSGRNADERRHTD